MAKSKPKKSTSSKGEKTRFSGDAQGFWWALLERGIDYADDLGTVTLSAMAIVTVLGLFGLTHGTLIDPWISLINRWLGFGAVLVPVILAIGAVMLVRHRQGIYTGVNWSRVIAIEIWFVGFLGLLSVFDGMKLPRAELGYGGGLIGWGVSIVLEDILGSVLRTIILIVAVLIFGVYGLYGVWARLWSWIENLDRKRLRDVVPVEEGDPAISVVVRPETTTPAITKPTTRLPRAYRKNFKVDDLPDERPARSVRREERLPPFELLDGGKLSRVTSKEINLTAGLIEKTLADFGLPVRVVNFRTGPAVTQFAVEPGYIEHKNTEGETRRQKVRVSQISGLANDLALSLSAPTLRIEAPVPGRSFVGIEVPNRRPSLVRLRPVLESEAFQSISSPLAIALGRDVSGAAVAADLAAMPHLLIAGTTGSGKSVCITALAACLAFENAPEDLRLVMIDPKMVELLRFNGLPHLIGKVETELERIIVVLRWCMAEMDRRYRLLEEAKARDIATYNRKTRRRKDAERLPRIVVMIDELADLMMMAPDQTESTLVRLAQMARATGIHLVLATQRPSTDILTGLIKANFPARISFAVASGVDSRVILDTVGAETLLGRGDMLFLSPEAGVPVRLQGVSVDDREIEQLIDYWQKEFDDTLEDQQPVPWEEMIAKQAAMEDRDEILEQAIELVQQRGEASASLLQRGLRIGYPRAARLMDELEEIGVVGRAQSGGRTREVLIGDDEDPLSPVDDEDEES
ncbi:MAG: DNA translocase FtsK [Anaerolineaceae bacterium]|nr:MAG: DNA translocase FtsK [Anaerolineaceae bacterium]